MLRKRRKQLTIRFLYRTSLFLAAFSTGVAFFFFFGNVQHFMDTTQTMILSILSASALMLVLVSLILLIPEISLFAHDGGRRLFMHGRRRHFFMILATVLCLFMGILYASVSRLIIVLSRGV